MTLGQDVHGKTRGVVGFGRIGQAVAGRAAGFGMHICYFDVQPVPKAVEAELGAQRLEFDHRLSRSDFVFVHVALTPETRHLFRADAFRKVKHTAVLVNSSHGAAVIDEVALVDALRRGEMIFAARLDVFENEPEVHPGLLEGHNAVMVPHLGSANVETRDAMGLLALDNLVAAMKCRGPPTLIDPNAWDQRWDGG